MIKDLKSLALRWAYKDNIVLPFKLPDAVIQMGWILNNVKYNDALPRTINLWLSMHSNTLPIPSLMQIISAVHAHWNTVKLGSDTTTTLTDNLVLYPPHVNSKTVSSCWLLMAFFVLIHLLIWIITASTDLDTYPTLRYYCDAASKHSTFFTSILQIWKSITYIF